MPANRIERYRECEAALRNPDLRQAMYDAGDVITRGTLLTLHGKPHLKRREIESRVFRRNFFRYYETEVFPTTLEQTIAPFIAAGGGDLIDLGYRLTVNLTADFAGVDRPSKTGEETEQLIRLTKKFSEAATMVHSTRDRLELEAEVRDAMAEFDEAFLSPSIARRADLLARFEAGEIGEDQLPRDILTVILRAQDELQFDHAQRVREVGFYMQAGSHSTANSVVHALDEILNWAGEDDLRWQRLRDPVFVQHCVHESLRLHPASPEAWREATCPMHVDGAGSLAEHDMVYLDFFKANRDPEVFGPDPERFDPDRIAPKGKMKTGLSFGFGTHHCLGRELDGGVLAEPGTPPEKVQFGIVPSVVTRLLAAGARRIAEDPPTPDPKTVRPNWGRYPVAFVKERS
ncbi:cytochrome P450 [Croceicoccus sp. BE223]|uniref:cytochrome P450 n=1 Tax=Croceicoccus sp. BE223 TaxID=2817716 RepID=UPI00285FA4B4|nr:cytochrome P450 [Croceicoccus sp. BE223]MDR7101660.1 cytochrome P450 [Croceicoccus sp. BE223]